MDDATAPSWLDVRVPGYGPKPSPYMLVGEAPGATEVAEGRPFCGPAGMELDRFLHYAGLSRYLIYTTNVSKTRPPLANGKQLPPSPEAIARDREELIHEILEVQPSYIGAVGRVATQWFLGADTRMALVHGIPQRWWICACGFSTTTEAADARCPFCAEEMRYVPVVPAYHTAAGLHNTEEQPKLHFDYEQFAAVCKGLIPPHPPVDAFPDPDYDVMTSGSYPLIRHAPVAVDTEGTLAAPWCLTFSQLPGTGTLVRAASREALARVSEIVHANTLVMHFGTHDWAVLRAMGVVFDARAYALRRIPQPPIVDTMVCQYLLGPMYPQALKDATLRQCGMEGPDYDELTAEDDRRETLAYLQRVLDAGKCGLCDGVGKVRSYGAKGQPLKSVEKCPLCLDGFTFPPSPPEVEFENGTLTITQPQSLGRKLRQGFLGIKAPKNWPEAEEVIAKLSDIAHCANAHEDDDAEASRAAATVETETQEKKRETLRKRWRKIPEEIRHPAEEVVGPISEFTLDAVRDQEVVRRYACRDADRTIRLYRDTLPRLEALGLLDVLDLDCSLIPMYERMQSLGMRVDVDYFRGFDAELERDMDEILNRLEALLGSPLNPQSSKQVPTLLFRRLGLPVIKLTKSRTRESTDDKVLEGLKASLKKRSDADARFALEVLELITDYRERSKLKGTYTEPLIRYADADSRVHTGIKYTRTDTGRLASGRLSPEAPPINLQNQPKRTPIGKRIRKGFVAKPGYSLISNDYSQVEMVVLADFTQSPNLLRAFREGLDLHRLAASMVFEVAYDQVTDDQRQSAKHLNFGLAYGISAMGLQAQMELRGVKVTEAWCQGIIDRYFATFALGVREWMAARAVEARRFGYVRDPLSGRIRWLPGARSEIKRVRAEAERQAGNFPIQCGAQTIIKRGMRRVWYDLLPMLWREGIDVEVIMQVHDELLSEAPDEHALLVAKLIAGELVEAVKLSLPLTSSYAVGKRWGEMEEMGKVAA